MKSYYFIIEIYRRGKLMTIVEMEKLSRVSAFLIASEEHHTEQKGECSVTINLSYVSDNNMYCLERFNADNMEAVRALALVS